MLKSVGNPSVRYGDQTIFDGGLIFGTPGEGLDSSSAKQNVLAGGSVDFANFSGVIFVCNHGTGSVAIFSCGAGATVASGTIGTTFGSLAYNAGINGYRWTNDTGATRDFTFLPLRLRDSA